MLATGIGRVSFGAFLGRCAACKLTSSFPHATHCTCVMSVCSSDVLMCHHFVYFIPVCVISLLHKLPTCCDWIQHIKTSIWCWLSKLHLDCSCCFYFLCSSDVDSFITWLNALSPVASQHSAKTCAPELFFFLLFALPDLSFITTWPFLWKVSSITLVSCLPLYIIKYLKRKFSPPSYSKLSSWAKLGLL